MAKKDAASKRLAEEIALAKRIKENPPSPSLLDLATPDQLDELAASLWLNEKDPVFGSVSRAFKAFGLDLRNNRDWYNLVAPYTPTREMDRRAAVPAPRANCFIQAPAPQGSC